MRINRKFIKSLALLIIGLPILNGCNQFLEENPDNRVDLDTVEKAAQLLTNSYTSAAYNFTEWMGDNVSYTTGTTRLTEHEQSYSWQDITSVNQDTPTYFWTSTYDAIAHANEV
jgi:starch-binding outer membrane protein, SusD/RagB family